MNFIVSFLLFFTKDEALAFSLLAALIDKFSLKKLYGGEMESLRGKFYQMDRLLHIHLPRLLEHFRFEGLSSSLYAPGWFVTLFTLTLDETKFPDGKERPSDFLITIWDNFITVGWKAIYKATIFILHKLEKKILHLNSEEILKLMKNLDKDNFWNDDKLAIEFKEEIKKLKITNTMLETLEFEFNNLLQNF